MSNAVVPIAHELEVHEKYHIPVIKSISSAMLTISQDLINLDIFGGPFGGQLIYGLTPLRFGVELYEPFRKMVQAVISAKLGAHGFIIHSGGPLFYLQGFPRRMEHINHSEEYVEVEYALDFWNIYNEATDKPNYIIEVRRCDTSTPGAASSQGNEAITHRNEGMLK